MKKLVVYGAVLVVMAVFMSGCATIFTEKTQKLTFKSKPDKAEVAVGTKTCITPCTMEIEKGKWTMHVMVTKRGYDAQSTALVPSIEPWAWANILTLNVGWAVDYVTGHLIKYEPEYYIPLTKK